ncbi:MAG: DUF1588 domain-containing protein [Lentisphaeraceae bacterium]|nr:DUF1588 domain-containing protein [Lentisphaeraceae bacterium]
MKLIVLLLMIPFALSAQDSLPKVQWDFVSKYCTDCHDEDMNEGDLNLDFEKVNWTSAKVRKHWGDVYTMLERGKMPPKKKKKQPSETEKKSFMAWLDKQLVAVSPIGGTPIRRLNQREYLETVKSVFGIFKFELPGSFPKDINSHGFDTEAKILVVSPSHFEAYAETAISVADYLFPPKKDAFKARSWAIKPEDLTISYSSAYIVDGAMRLASTGQKTRNGTWPSKFEVPVSGKYKVNLVLSSFNPPKETPIVILKAHSSGRGSNERLLGKFTVKAGAPQEFSVDVSLYKGETLLFLYENSPFNYGDKKNFNKFLLSEFVANPKMAAAWAKLKKVPRGGIGWERVKKVMQDPKLDSSKFKAGSKEIKKLIAGMDKNPVNIGETLVYKYFEEGPNIGIHEVKVSGPVSLIEDEEIVKQGKAQERFLGNYKKTLDTNLNKFLESYLSKAFRRDITEAEVKKYTAFVKQEVAAGNRIEDGLHLAIRASLISPSFIYREQGKGDLSQDELASRLSYFLTSSPPGFQLREKADLHKPETLRYQAGRLIKSSEAKKFIEGFTAQWLDTAALDTIMPDNKLIKKFTFAMREGMKEEVVTTFREILVNNMSCREFIDPDFIYTNSAVGKDIYSLKKVPKNGKGKLGKVSIPRGTTQGGILSMPAVMMATANGVDTQPVLRGVWILENVLGTPPPEPPKNVPALPPDTADAVGPRAKLAAHMDTASCQSCHEDIDPMGFVLENFDAVGRWRTAYPKKGKIKSMKVDASATMPNGTKLNDVRDLKRFLVKNPEYFTGCLARKLMSYATGRQLNYREKKIIGEIVAKNIATGNKFQDLLLDLIDSEVFRAR